MTSVLIIGAYGFIGAEVTRSLLSAGHQVHALGRDARLLEALGSTRVWCRDLRDMTQAQDWAAALAGIDVVVNASGVLQDGPRDDVERVQRYAIAAMAEAASQSGVRRIVQISAVGAHPNADTPFMASKGVADQALLSGPVETVILRPGLVLGRSVYGGTALLRILAAIPVIQPIAFAEARIQTVAMADLVAAVLAAVHGQVRSGQSYDLVAEDAVSLAELVVAVRRWLGFPKARWVFPLGSIVARLVSGVADVAGVLGWRSPLRSSAMTVLRRGVTGDPETWQMAGHPPCHSLSEALRAMPATLQDRIHARMALVMPLVVVMLSAFWILSGTIGVLSFDEASRLLIYRGFDDETAQLFVGLGSAADLVLGLSVLVRRWTRPAMLGMAAVCLGYLAAGTLWTPDLWADPLGPFVKVLPALMLACVGYFLLDER